MAKVEHEKIRKRENKKPSFEQKMKLERTTQNANKTEKKDHMCTRSLALSNLPCISNQKRENKREMTINLPNLFLTELFI